jgi:hypothetical protein
MRGFIFAWKGSPAGLLSIRNAIVPPYPARMVRPEAGGLRDLIENAAGDKEPGGDRQREPVAIPPFGQR